MSKVIGIPMGFLICVFFFSSSLSAQGVGQLKKDIGIKTLFDGKSTDLWRSYRGTAFPAKGWVIENGTLRHQARAGGGDIVSKEKFENFELRLDWKVAPGGNSGVMYRVSEEGEQPWNTGPEMQVLDDAGHRDGKSPLTSAGSLYALIGPAKKVVKPAGAWNSARLVVNGNHVEHWLNGEKIVECELNSPDLKAKIAASKFSNQPRFALEKSGHIVLQDHGDDVWFREIKIRVLAQKR